MVIAMSGFLDTSGACILCCGLALATPAPFDNARAASFTLLHSFQGPPDGWSPYSGLIRDRAGAFYGTTQHGGSQNCNCGTVFELASDGTASRLRRPERKESFTPSREEPTARTLTAI
jgi:uncharacterized repeat protein (TIGR03803 family)